MTRGKRDVAREEEEEAAVAKVEKDCIAPCVSWQMKRSLISRKRLSPPLFLPNNVHKTHFFPRKTRQRNTSVDFIPRSSNTFLVQIRGVVNLKVNSVLDVKC